MLTFEELNNRYILRCELESEECLHIGSGQEGATTDAAFITRGDAPFLPGSSIRGVLRSTVERLLRALVPHKRIACVLYGGEIDDCAAGHEDTRKTIERGDKTILDAVREGRELCPICRMFGSTVMAARLKVSDATQPPARVRRTEVRDGVGIDRDTGSAKEEIKYNFEALDSGAAFSFRMELENAERDELALLFVVLAELKRGIEVGGKKNRGFGRVRLRDYTVEYLGQDNMEEFLRTGEARSLTRPVFEAEIERTFGEFLRAKRQ